MRALAVAGGVDAGGQNVYVANVARQLVRKGHRVDVFTRRESRSAPGTVVDAGVRVVHVDAAASEVLPEEDLLPHLGPFAAFLLERARREAAAGDATARLARARSAGSARGGGLGLPVELGLDLGRHLRHELVHGALGGDVAQLLALRVAERPAQRQGRA